MGEINGYDDDDEKSEFDSDDSDVANKYENPFKKIFAGK